MIMIKHEYKLTDADPYQHSGLSSRFAKRINRLEKLAEHRKQFLGAFWGHVNLNPSSSNFLYHPTRPA